MEKGIIKTEKITPNTGSTWGEFSLDFKDASFGPYTHIFYRENLYFNEQTEQRGSYFFPLKSSYFGNTEIFLETDKVIIAIGERGSFSGKSKRFIELINLNTAAKYRLYPDEVSLIYNAHNSIVIYYRKSGSAKKLILDFDTLEKKSEQTYDLDAFFKLLYSFTEQKFKRLYYIPNSSSHKAGYFEEQDINIQDDKVYVPKVFNVEKFRLMVTNNGNQSGHHNIDVWEASLTGEIK